MEQYKIQYSIDEFMTYVKIAMAGKWNIKDFNRNDFDVQGIHNKLKVQSGGGVFEEVAISKTSWIFSPCQEKEATENEYNLNNPSLNLFL